MPFQDTVIMIIGFAMQTIGDIVIYHRSHGLQKEDPPDDDRDDGTYDGVGP